MSLTGTSYFNETSKSSKIAIQSSPACITKGPSRTGWRDGHVVTHGYRTDKSHFRKIRIFRSDVNGNYEYLVDPPLRNVALASATAALGLQQGGDVTPTVSPLYADCEVDVRLLSAEQAEREIMQCFLSVEPGQTLEIKMSDPEMAEELKAWADSSGNHLLGMAGDARCQRIYIERQY
jgi:hypothetical protein